MPKQSQLRRIADNAVLVLIARVIMAVTGPAVAMGATLFYNGQVEMRKTLDDIKLDLARLTTTQQIAGENRDRSIASIDSRLTFLERQGHK